MQLITGNTYPVKEQIKALGGTWNKAAQGWMVPDEHAPQARLLVASAVPSPPPRSRRAPRRFRYDGRGVSNVARFSSGAVIHTNKSGRCEDAPCCGCCS